MDASGWPLHRITGEVYALRQVDVWDDGVPTGVDIEAVAGPLPHGIIKAGTPFDGSEERRAWAAAQPWAPIGRVASGDAPLA